MHSLDIKCVDQPELGHYMARRHCLKQMEPIEFGGEMIDHVDLYESTWKELPWKFEGGHRLLLELLDLERRLIFCWKLEWMTLIKHEKQFAAYAYGSN